MPSVEQELITLPEHSSSTTYNVVRVAQYLVFCVVICRLLFVFFAPFFWPLLCISILLRITASDYYFCIFRVFVWLQLSTKTSKYHRQANRTHDNKTYAFLKRQTYTYNYIKCYLVAEWSNALDIMLAIGVVVYQRCQFESCRGRENIVRSKIIYSFCSNSNSNSKFYCH